MAIDAVIPAAGIGRRMGSAVPKQYLQLAGKTVLQRTLEIFLNSPLISRVIVCLKEGDPYFDSLSVSRDPRLIRAPGGAERCDSVLAGLRCSEAEWVMVHDAARPCLTGGDLRLLAEEAISRDGGLLCAPVRDTMKRAGEDMLIQGTVDRNGLYHALTPQMFRRTELLQALEDAASRGLKVTDESSAMELAGCRPLAVAGRADNIKITSQGDLELAEFILEGHRRNGIV